MVNQISTPPAGEPLTTAADMADRLGISSKTVWKLAREGKIPVVKVSRRCMRFDAGAVVDAMTKKVS